MPATHSAAPVHIRVHVCVSVRVALYSEARSIRRHQGMSVEVHRQMFMHLRYGRLIHG